MSQYDVNLRDYWRILRKRKGIVAILTLAFGAVAYLLAEVQKPDPTYQATAVVKFERSTTLVGLLVETVSVSSGDNLATQAAIVRSFPVLERAAKALRMVPADLDSEAIKRDPRFVQLLSAMRQQVVAAPEENTTLINITVTSSDPAQAARLANALAQAYQEENYLTRNRQVREARRFIEGQTAEVTGRLQAAEDGIRLLKERRGFVSLPEETTALLTRQATLESEYDKVRRTQQETADQIEALQNPQVVAGVTTPRIFTDAGDPTIAKLNSTLLDFGVERENLLQTLTPEHPQIRDLNARIATARESLVRELRLKIQTLQGRSGEVQRQIQQIRQAALVLPDVARQHTQLQRDMTINETLLSQLRSKLQEVQIKEKEQAEEVTLVRPAIEPSRPTNPPQTTSKGVVGLLIGLTIGLVLAFVLESLDTSIGTIQDVESYLEVPVLGLIPSIDPGKDPVLASAEDEETDGALARMRPFLVCLLSPKSTVAEAHRSLRTNVEFLSLEKNIKTLCLTSATLREGKTTTAINLATTLAQMGKKTLLVEADLRRPFIHHAFGIPRDPGLAEAIVGNKDWRECLRTIADLILGPLGLEKVMTAPSTDKLHILTSGTPPPNPTEFLNSQRMTDLIAAFRQEFDIVIFDCPPILPVTDAAILASRTDGALIVYRVGHTARSALKRSKALLENVRGKVLGIVLTGVRAEVSPDYDELEYYRYTYGQEPDSDTRPRTGRQAGESLPGKLAGFLMRTSIPGKALLLVPLGALLAGAWAWSSGAWPIPWDRGFSRVADSPSAAPPPLSVPAAVVPAPTTEIGRAPESSSTVPPGLGSSPTVASSPAVGSAPPSALLRESPESDGPARPFALQVASSRTRSWSQGHAEALRNEGLEAFTIPVELPQKGEWYRVLIGAFVSAAAAAESQEDLRAKGQIDQALVVSLPYAVEVADLASADRVAKAMEAVRRSGYLALLHPDGRTPASGSGQTMLVQAFGTTREAERVADSLRADGFRPRVIRR